MAKPHAPHRRRAVLAATAALMALALLGLTPTQATFAEVARLQTPLTTVPPVEVLFVGISAGNAASLGWTASGDLYTWGANANSQLGTGDTTQRLSPTLIAVPGGVRIATASMGFRIGAAAAADGQLFTWGGTVTTPTAVTGVTGRATGVSCGGGFCMAWTDAGALYSWGDNTNGKLGFTGPNTTTAAGRVTAGNLNNLIVRDASAGQSHGAASTSTNSIISWGAGLGTTTGTVMTGLPGGSVPAGIDVGNAMTLVWTTAGILYGAPAAGFTQVPNLPTTIVKADVSEPSAAGINAFHALTSTGTFYGWGENSFGQLGVGNTLDQANPVAVTLPAGLTISMWETADFDSLILGTDGRYSGTGLNVNGPLGMPGGNRITFSPPFLYQKWP